MRFAQVSPSCFRFLRLYLQVQKLVVVVVGFQLRPGPKLLSLLYHGVISPITTQAIWILAL